jgi:hypothetical protein
MIVRAVHQVEPSNPIALRSAATSCCPGHANLSKTSEMVYKSADILGSKENSVW